MYRFASFLARQESSWEGVVSNSSGEQCLPYGLTACAGVMPPGGIMASLGRWPEGPLA